LACSLEWINRLYGPWLRIVM